METQAGLRKLHQESDDQSYICQSRKEGGLNGRPLFFSEKLTPLWRRPRADEDLALDDRNIVDTKAPLSQGKQRSVCRFLLLDQVAQVPQ